MERKRGMPLASLDPKTRGAVSAIAAIAGVSIVSMTAMFALHVAHRSAFG